MNLLKPFRVTLKSNLNEDKTLKNDDLTGLAVIGWVELGVKEGKNGQPITTRNIVLGVVWEDKILDQAIKIYKNEEVVAIGAFDEDYENELELDEAYERIEYLEQKLEASGIAFSKDDDYSEESEIVTN